MKFDVFAWKKVNTDAPIIVKKGRVRLQLSAHRAVYAAAEGVEALVGYAASFDVEFSQAVGLRVEPKDVDAFLYEPVPTTHVPVGEVYTNIDREPNESGSVLEVTKALRMFKLESREVMRGIRAERDKLVRERQAASEVEVIEPDPEPEAEPDPAPVEPEGEAGK